MRDSRFRTLQVTMFCFIKYKQKFPRCKGRRTARLSRRGHSPVFSIASFFPACFSPSGTNYLRSETVIIDKIALALLIIGGLNWGSVGLFQFDLVAFACGGSASMISRIIYTIVGLSAVWCISLLFRDMSDKKN